MLMRFVQMEILNNFSNIFNWKLTVNKCLSVIYLTVGHKECCLEKKELKSSPFSLNSVMKRFS